jgi:hypothetical protein
MALQLEKTLDCNKLEYTWQPLYGTLTKEKTLQPHYGTSTKENTLRPLDCNKLKKIPDGHLIALD